MVKYLFVILLLSIFIISPVLGQERTIMELLTSYKWIRSQSIIPFDPDDPDEPYIMEHYMTFSETTWTIYIKWSDTPNELEVGSNPYYIGLESTDVNINNPNAEWYDKYAQTKFDTTKVGKNKNGNMLLIGSNKSTVEEASLFEIREINDNKLILRLVTPETLGGGVISEWIARPKD